MSAVASKTQTKDRHGVVLLQGVDNSEFKNIMMTSLSSRSFPWMSHNTLLGLNFYTKRMLSSTKTAPRTQAI